MKVVHACQRLEKSIFLAGPTPRSADVTSWRPEAINILQELKFDGTVFVPESKDWHFQGNYDDQLHWEWEALNMTTAIVFWVPRELDTMPAFTTNVEFGLFAHSSKVVLGYPHTAPKMKYLEGLANRYNITIRHSLYTTLFEAVDKTNRPFGLNNRT